MGNILITNLPHVTYLLPASFKVMVGVAYYVTVCKSSARFTKADGSETSTKYGSFRMVISYLTKAAVSMVDQLWNASDIALIPREGIKQKFELLSNVGLLKWKSAIAESS